LLKFFGGVEVINRVLYKHRDDEQAEVVGKRPSVFKLGLQILYRIG